jgi:dynein heavy chain
VEDYVYPVDSVPEYASILVPNVDNVCTTFLIDTIAKQNKAVMLIGEQGTAKTVMIKSYASRYDPERQLFKTFNFSSASTPMLFQVRLTYLHICQIMLFLTAENYRELCGQKSW